MENEIQFSAYKLQANNDRTYTAIVRAYGRIPQIVIPEEYDGIPITEMVVCGYTNEPVRTICVSKNVKTFMNSDLYYDNQPYLVEISPENPWLCADNRAVFSKDKKILYAFTALKDKSYTIPDGVKSIYNSAFYATSPLRDLKFPDGLEEIGDKAFYGSGVREWRLPKSVKKIGFWAFAYINAKAFILPESIKEMSHNAFDGTKCLSAVYIPDCFDKPEYQIPSGYFAPEYYIDENSRTLTMIDGVIYTKDMKALLAVSQNAPSVITVPDGVEVIGNKACENNFNVREIILPNSVHTILNNAFSHSKLERIDLENVKIIEDEAFSVCGKLVEVGKIGAEKIGWRGFADCSSLGNVWLTDIKELGDCALWGLKKNAKIFLAEGLETIGQRALESKFSSVRIPRSASMSNNCISKYWRVIELYDADNSVIYKKDPKINDFGKECLIKVLSPDTDEVMYAVKIFEAEETYDVINSQQYINSLFGGERFFDLKKYDEYFETVYSRDHLLSKYEAAHYRIKYPAELTDHARAIYMKYIEEFAADVIEYALDMQDVTAGDIADFPYLDKIGEEELIEFVTLSAKKGLTEITVFLMNYKNEHFQDPVSSKYDL